MATLCEFGFLGKKSRHEGPLKRLYKNVFEIIQIYVPKLVTKTCSSYALQWKSQTFDALQINKKQIYK